MRLLLDRGDSVTHDLEEHWVDPATFAFLPQRGGVPEEWAARALEGIPDSVRTGHFALLSSGSTGEPRLVLASRSRAETLARTLHVVQASEPIRRTVPSRSCGKRLPAKWTRITAGKDRSPKCCSSRAT